MSRVKYLNVVTETIMGDDVGDRQVSVNILTEDCLSEIFNNLSFVDRVRIERVCQRWLSVSRISWCTYLTRTRRRLEIGSDTGHFPRAYREEEVILDTLKRILQRFGFYLDELSFSYACRERLAPGCLHETIRFCPRIKRLDVRNLRIQGNDLRAIAQHCNNLESLQLNEVYRSYRYELCDVIQRNRNLRRLSITGGNWFTNDHLQRFDPLAIQSLKVWRCERFWLNRHFVERFSASLTELEIAFTNRTPFCDSIRLVAQLTNLRRLTLSVDCTNLNVDLVMGIVNYCTQLERLEFKDETCAICRDSLIVPLFRLPRLRELLIWGVSLLTDALFNDRVPFALEALLLPCCRMTRGSVLDFARRLSTLRYLNFCHCIDTRSGTSAEASAIRNISVVIRDCTSERETAPSYYRTFYNLSA